MELDAVDKRLLNLLQSDFPLSAEPFALLGGRLNIGGDEVIQRVKNLKDGGIIRWISGVFDSSKLGYESTLVAMRISDHRLDEAASAISEHAGVSHNYARDHYYNLWFTLTLAKNQSLPKTIANLAELAGAEATMSLPAVRVFKRLVYFDMVGTEKPESNLHQHGESTQEQRLPSRIRALGVIASPSPDPERSEGEEAAKQSHHKYIQDCFVANAPRNDIGMWQHQLGSQSLFLGSNGLFITKKGKRLSRLEKEVVKELQTDLPLAERPFDQLASHLDIGTDELLDLAKSLQARGIMRRYGALLSHQKAGFLVNAMSCWSVPLDMLEQAGNKMASCQAVSHCYQRQTNANWPYNLFAMIHTRSKDECEAIANQISHDTKVSKYVLLYTTKEYKKEKVRYFTEPN